MADQNYKIQQISYLRNFKCLADKCPDTCCSQWTINVDENSKALYEKEAPEIAKEVEPNDGDEFRMRRFDNGDCVQLEGGLCKVQKNYGEKFLPDICHSFPRTYKKFGTETYMTANLACPESLRVGLYSPRIDDFSSWEEIYKERTKSSSYDLRSDNLANINQEELIEIYNSITRTVDDPDFSADEALARLLLISNHLDKNEEFNWPVVKDRIFDFTNRNKILEVSRENEDGIDMKNEMKNILTAMFTVINRDRPRYNFILGLIKQYVGSDKDSVNWIHNNYQLIKNNWQGKKERKFDPILKNLLKTQLSHKLFPIGCYFRKKYHSMLNIALEYLTVKLALMVRSHQLSGNLDEKEIIDTIQPVTKRFYVRTEQEIFDYCKEAGWSDDLRMISIVLNF